MMRMPLRVSSGDEPLAVDSDLTVNRALNCASRGVGGEGAQRVASRDSKVGAPIAEDDGGSASADVDATGCCDGGAAAAATSAVML